MFIIVTNGDRTFISVLYSRSMTCLIHVINLICLPINVSIFIVINSLVRFGTLSETFFHKLSSYFNVDMMQYFILNNLNVILNAIASNYRGVVS